MVDNERRRTEMLYWAPIVNGDSKTRYYPNLLSIKIKKIKKNK